VAFFTARHPPSLKGMDPLRTIFSSRAPLLLSKN
jgi:hypothetical protein